MSCACSRDLERLPMVLCLCVCVQDLSKSHSELGIYELPMGHFLLDAAGWRVLYEVDIVDTVFDIRGGPYALEDAGSIPLSDLLEDPLERCTEIFGIVDSVTVWYQYLERQVQKKKKKACTVLA